MNAQISGWTFKEKPGYGFKISSSKYFLITVVDNIHKFFATPPFRRWTLISLPMSLGSPLTNRINTNSVVEKPGRHNLNQGLKINVTSNKIYLWYDVTSNKTLWYDAVRRICHLWLFFPQIYSSSLLVWRHFTKPTSGNSTKYQTNSPKSGKVIKEKDRLTKLSQIKGN